MKMLQQLTYRSPSAWRPQAKIIEESSIGLWGVCFSWGDLDLSEKLFENIRFFVEAVITQSEITNPFGYLEGLSELENALRAGCSLANDVIYRLVNKSNFAGGLECAVFIKRGRELVSLSVGQPHVFLLRNEKLVPLLTAFDFTPSREHSGVFIPSRLLGVNSSSHPHLRSFHYEKGDELILLAHSYTPRTLFSSEEALSSDKNLQNLFQGLIREIPQCPFWLARLSL